MDTPLVDTSRSLCRNTDSKRSFGVVQISLWEGCGGGGGGGGALNTHTRCFSADTSRSSTNFRNAASKWI